MKTKIGKVVHYYNGIGVAVVALDLVLMDGDRITITKRNGLTNFNQIVESMEINHERIHEAGGGYTIGLKVKQRVRVNDSVYKELPVGVEQIIRSALLLVNGLEALNDAEAKLRVVRKHIETFPSIGYDSVPVWFEKLKKLVGTRRVIRVQEK